MCSLGIKEGIKLGAIGEQALLCLSIIYLLNCLSFWKKKKQLNVIWLNLHDTDVRRTDLIYFKVRGPILV